MFFVGVCDQNYLILKSHIFHLDWGHFLYRFISCPISLVRSDKKSIFDKPIIYWMIY